MQKKLMKNNESYYVNLPKQVCEMFGWNNDTSVNIQIGKNKTIIVSEVKNDI